MAWNALFWLQISFEKQADSPSAAGDADASDVQSVDSSVSRPSGKRDTVCQVCVHKRVIPAFFGV